MAVLVFTRNPKDFGPGAAPSEINQAFYAGIVTDDIENAPGYGRKRERSDHEMNKNAAFAECLKIRCMQWW
eukprot:14967317-Heterocapsa_arctica.AAC.1